MRLCGSKLSCHESLSAVLILVDRSWGRAIQNVPWKCQSRFLDAMVFHTDAMTQQADDRSRNYLPMRTIQSYLQVRRHTMGAKPAFAFLAFDFDIPCHILDSPTICKLEMWATDLLILSNVSYTLQTSHLPLIGYWNRIYIHTPKNTQMEMMDTTSSQLS